MLAPSQAGFTAAADVAKSCKIPLLADSHHKDPCTCDAVLSQCCRPTESVVMDPHLLFSLNDHLEALSRHGDTLEALEKTVDFEYCRS